jgi:hypothetical protein
VKQEKEKPRSTDMHSKYHLHPLHLLTGLSGKSGLLGSQQSLVDPVHFVHQRYT